MTGRIAMATINELAQAVAEAEGMDPATVALIARYLREEGLIQKKGRGPSAAQMNVADAANLLIAVNASGAARDAALVVPIYRDLVTRVEEKFWFDSPLDAALSQPAPSKVSGTFGDAIELLLQSAIEGKLPNAILSQEVPSALQDAFQKGAATISIHFTRPEASGFLYISGGEWPGPPGLPVGAPRPPISLHFYPKRSRSNRTAQKLKVGDRADETKIGNRTIASVAKILTMGGRVPVS
jgi:hypothetical protein